MSTKILEKIQKLLNLANGAGATDGERDNALRMVHGLLAKHNLDMADLDSLNVTEKRINESYDGWSMKFSGTLAIAISKLFFCKAYCGQKVNGTKSKFRFVGKEGNVRTAILMHEFVTNSILKECRKNWKHNLAPESRAFSLGASSRVLARVKELMDTPLASGTGLMVVEVYKQEEQANEEFIADMGVKLKYQVTKSKAVDSDAYLAGQAFGDKINLHGQVSGTSAGRAQTSAGNITHI